MNQTPNRLFLKTILVPFGLIILIWLIYSIEIRYNLNFNKFGIYPKRFEGLVGIFFSPFIHGDISHLYSNTFPLLILSLSLFYFYKSVAFKILFFSILFTGLLTWCIGRESYHIGASGLIYALFSFLFVKGILTKYYRLIALSLLVVFLYGSMIWYTLPIEEHISWEGHLSGFIVGILLAFFFKKNIFIKETFVWEEPSFVEENDPFLKQFNDDGYFFEIDSIEDETQNDDFFKSTESSSTSELDTISYSFKPKDNL
jgi:membrane associated rhomboid family serine protease